jgi:hypothetical protein
MEKDLMILPLNIAVSSDLILNNLNSVNLSYLLAIQFCYIN